MKILLGLLVGCLAVALGTNQLAAQHLHKHGNHVDVHQNVPHGHDHAGHLTDSLGHHIDGHGRHTGAIGVYENGARSYHPPHYLNNSSMYYGSGLYGYGSGYGAGYGMGYSGMGYSGMGYSGLGYSGLGLSVYVPPIVRSQVIVNGSSPTLGTSIPSILGSSQVLTSPLPNVVATTRRTPPGMVANKIPITGSGGKIVLRNPRKSGGSIHYALNEFAYQINPGESQTLEQDRQWLIKFDNGLGQTIEQELQAGNYEFRVSQQTGWEVVSTTAP
jgi:hypothetical protein